MCKKKSDSVDTSTCKSPTPFDRIINRLHVSTVVILNYSELSLNEGVTVSKCEYLSVKKQR